jgi:hypothetical protein
MSTDEDDSSSVGPKKSVDPSPTPPIQAEDDNDRDCNNNRGEDAKKQVATTNNKNATDTDTTQQECSINLQTRISVAKQPTLISRDNWDDLHCLQSVQRLPPENESGVISDDTTLPWPRWHVEVLPPPQQEKEGWYDMTRAAPPKRHLSFSRAKRIHKEISVSKTTPQYTVVLRIPPPPPSAQPETGYPPLKQLGMYRGRLCFVGRPEDQILLEGSPMPRRFDRVVAIDDHPLHKLEPAFLKALLLYVPTLPKRKFNLCGWQSTLTESSSSALGSQKSPPLSVAPAAATTALKQPPNQPQPENIIDLAADGEGVSSWNNDDDDDASSAQVINNDEESVEYSSDDDSYERQLKAKRKLEEGSNSDQKKPYQKLVDDNVSKEDDDSDFVDKGDDGINDDDDFLDLDTDVPVAKKRKATAVVSPPIPRALQLKQQSGTTSAARVVYPATSTGLNGMDRTMTAASVATRPMYNPSPQIQALRNMAWHNLYHLQNINVAAATSTTPAAPYNGNAGRLGQGQVIAATAPSAASAATTELTQKRPMSTSGKVPSYVKQAQTFIANTTIPSAYNVLLPVCPNGKLGIEVTPFVLGTDRQWMSFRKFVADYPFLDKMSGQFRRRGDIIIAVDGIAVDGMNKKDIVSMLSNNEDKTHRMLTMAPRSAVSQNNTTAPAGSTNGSSSTK